MVRLTVAATATITHSANGMVLDVPETVQTEPNAARLKSAMSVGTKKHVYGGKADAEGNQIITDRAVRVTRHVKSVQNI